MDWVSLLQENGLAVVCVFALGFACWFLLKRILSDHEKDRTVWKEVIDKQSGVNQANILKLTEAVQGLTSCINTHDSNNSNQHQRIVDALNRINREG